MDSSTHAMSVRSVNEPTYVYPDAGGAIVTHKNRFLSDYSVFPWGNEVHPIRTQFLFCRNRRETDCAIYLLTPEAEGNFYHWIFDAIPKLELMRGFFGYDQINMPLILHQEAAPYEEESLRLGGFEYSRIFRLQSDEVLRCQNLLIPRCFFGLSDTHVEKVRLLNLFFRNAAPIPKTQSSAGKTYYISRRKAKKRIIRNEETLIRRLKPLGVEVIHLESMGLEHQIRCFRQARMVIAPHGAGLVLSAFMRKGAALVEMMNRYCPMHHYRKIAQAGGISYHAILVNPVDQGYPNALLKDRIHGNALDLYLEENEQEQIISITKANLNQ